LYKQQRNFWVKVFLVYAIIELIIQLLFLFTLNNFGGPRTSIIEYHLIMWMFQCLLILPIWWVARLVYKQPVIVQVLVNTAFYVLYCLVWFGLVQDAILYLYNHLQEVTRPVTDRQQANLDRGNGYAFLKYQLLKHSFRLAWFYVAAFFYKYKGEEKLRLQLALANKELQLKTLKWRLNPSFYFKTINHLQQVAAEKPANAVQPILQLSKTMEYVIYEAKEKLIEVKKELVFLESYIQLLNKQAENNRSISLSVQGNYTSLLIAPLLLSGLADSIMENEKETAKFTISLVFEGREMKISIRKNDNTPVTLSAESAAMKQIDEIYTERYTSKPGGTSFEIQIKLDEAE
jgi:Histidine kinase